MTQLLSDTLEYRKKNNVERQDYIDYLIHLREKKGIELVDMVAHTASFFFDGIETSSVTLTNLFYELAKTPNVQQKLRDELLSIRNKDGGFDYDQVTDLKYLEQVIYETLRLHPILAVHIRQCNADFNVDLANGEKLTIAKGMNVSLPIYNISRDEEYYDQPEEFNPDRFNDENGGIKLYRDKCVLFPFGDGPRICLGQRFALTQMKCLIAYLLTNFEITVDPKMPAKPEIDPEQFLLLFKGGYWLNFKEIKQ